MTKTPVKSTGRHLRREDDLSRLKGGARGKYYRRATARTNLVLVAPELAGVFPDTESVNRALRLLVNTATVAPVTPLAVAASQRGGIGGHPKGAIPPARFGNRILCQILPRSRS